MQTSSAAYAIGYFLGSAERGVYSTLQAELCSITNMNTEISFQTVYQNKISQEHWNMAKDKASLTDSNPNSKHYKKVLYLNSTTALVVYVDKRENTEYTRQNYMTCMGSLLVKETGLLLMAVQ